MRELVLAADETCAAEARGFATACLAEMGVRETEAFDILLALNEAVVNACRHAYPPRWDRGEIVIRCHSDGQDFHVTVSDRGNGFDFEEEMFEMPDPLSQRGRGFSLMNELMDGVRVTTSDAGTEVSMHRTVPLHANGDHHLADR